MWGVWSEDVGKAGEAVRSGGLAVASEGGGGRGEGEEEGKNGRKRGGRWDDEVVDGEKDPVGDSRGSLWISLYLVDGGRTQSSVHS